MYTTILGPVAKSQCPAAPPGVTDRQGKIKLYYINFDLLVRIS